MRYLRDSTVKVADMQVQYLAQRSQELDQETRATVYQFGNTTECLYYDKDVLRLPSIAQTYNIQGNTALIDATINCIEDLQKTATLYGDHAFLIYVLTDGQENSSRKTLPQLKALLNNLPDNWTLAVFVPDQNGVFEAKKLGFAPGNIAVWDTSEKGIKEVGETIRRTTDAYMEARATGIRSTKGLFELGVGNVSDAILSDKLARVSGWAYKMYPVAAKEDISSFVARNTGKPYRKGSAFYQLTKPEEVQPQKAVCVYSRHSDTLYEGAQARKTLGLPDYTVKVAPVDHPAYDIFIQSTSTNRNLVPGTNVLVF
jgi:hypothetical protein